MAALLGLVALIDTRVGDIPSEAPAYRVTHIAAAHRPDGLDLHLWYPASAGQITLIGQNALFYGFHARRDAVGDGISHPLVLLSHGSGGNAERLGWIGSALASKGIIVAAVNHPGTTSGDSQPSRTVMPWERTEDLSTILDYLQADAPQGMVPDMNRVGALGFSLGGASVLLSAGARLSKDDFIQYCAANAGQDDCGWLAEGGVDFSQIDAPKYERDNRDQRIKAVVAIDPALTRAMRKHSLTRLPPSLVINLGSDGEIPLAMQADGLAAVNPAIEYRTVPGARHFSFLARCSLLGVVMIALAGDDNICSDRGLRDRGEIQAELVQMIGTFLTDRL
ncbi:alpha/beta hydrolase family protein [Paragemmobacter aquarius]|uniref:alpha/beta hydrolase family protein n=1 Tax=Paragemmobacter aquarius TaxID=2169400 RepID=UPI001C1F50E2|nr:hypothetical protein [Gemmobacter aquarius]